MTNIRSLLKTASEKISPVSSEAQLDVELLLSQVLGKNRAYLLAHPEQELSEIENKAFQTYLSKRAQGIPLAYILGYRDFYTLRLKVNEHTLIPRQDTELLVELALELIPNQQGVKVLDLGTGSGAIALSLAKARPHWEIHATDSSAKALAVAKENAQTNSITNVQFYQSYWFDELTPLTYNAIVSNPPYIAADDPHLIQDGLPFEPQTALVSSQEGLADLQYIAQNAIDWLLPSGLLLLEHGYEQKNKISSILDRLGYKNVQSYRDIQGQDRVSGGWRPEG